MCVRVRVCVEWVRETDSTMVTLKALPVVWTKKWLHFLVTFKTNTRTFEVIICCPFQLGKLPKSTTLLVCSHQIWTNDNNSFPYLLTESEIYNWNKGKINKDGNNQTKTFGEKNTMSDSRASSSEIINEVGISRAVSPTLRSLIAIAPLPAPLTSILWMKHQGH